jgi:hypothetical protein
MQLKSRAAGMECLTFDAVLMYLKNLREGLFPRRCSELVARYPAMTVQGVLKERIFWTPGEGTG